PLLSDIFVREGESQDFRVFGRFTWGANSLIDWITKEEATRTLKNIVKVKIGKVEIPEAVLEPFVGGLAEAAAKRLSYLRISHGIVLDPGPYSKYYELGQRSIESIPVSDPNAADFATRAAEVVLACDTSSSTVYGKEAPDDGRAEGFILTANKNNLLLLDPSV